MDITILPNDLSITTENALQLYNYKSFTDIEKTKINLSKNTISFLRKGKKEVIGETKSVQIDKEQFLIMKSGNCLMTEKVSSSNHYYHSILLFFSDEEVLDFLERHQLYQSKPSENKSFFVFAYDDFIQHFVMSLAHIVKLPNPTQQMVLKAKFEELMLYLAHHHSSGFLNELVQRADDKMSRLNNIVESNKLNKLSLDELAFLCNMSVSTFKRAFSKQFQTSPMKWFMAQRLHHAAFILKTKRKRPIDLYEEAGYESFSNFVQAFKKEFGLTPKEYQRKN